MFIKTDDPNFIRDKRNSAVINIDKAGYQRFKLEREKALQAQQLQQQVADMQSEMRDIKQMLQQLLNGK